MQEEATELEWLKYFYRVADFGPAHEDVVWLISQQFQKETGKALPYGYKDETNND